MSEPRFTVERVFKNDASAWYVLDNATATLMRLAPTTEVYARAVAAALNVTMQEIPR